MKEPDYAQIEQKLTALAMMRIVKEFCSLIPAHD